MTDKHLSESPAGGNVEIDQVPESTQLNNYAGTGAIVEVSEVEAGQFLGVTLCNTPCLIAVNDIVEVIPAPEILEVPLVKPWLRGITGFQGGFIAITDIQMLLSGDQPSTGSDKVIIVAYLGKKFGLQTGAIHRIYKLNETAFEPVDVDDSALSFYVDKSVAIDNRQWFLLDIGKLVSSERFMGIAA